MQIATSLILLLGVLQAVTATFETELWPGEGRPVFEATGRALALYDAAAPTANQVGQISVRPGQPIVFDDTRYRTVSPGRLRALIGTQVTGRLIGPRPHVSRQDYYGGSFPPAVKAVAAGATLELLQHRAEGTCFVRIAGDVLDAQPCPTADDRAFRVEAEPTVEWWIRVVSSTAPSGWVMVDDRTVKVARREF